MRLIHLKSFILGLSLLLTATSFSQAQTGITFENSNWKSVLEKAKKQNKLVFLDAYTTWCGPCKAMQARVFPDQQLGNFYNAHFINVKIDMEQGEGLKLANKYPIQGYPTLLFIDPVTEKVVNQALGYRNIEQLMKLGQQVAAKTK